MWVEKKELLVLFPSSLEILDCIPAPNLDKIYSEVNVMLIPASTARIFVPMYEPFVYFYQAKPVRLKSHSRSMYSPPIQFHLPIWTS